MQGSVARAAVKKEGVRGGLWLRRARLARCWALLLVAPLLLVSVSAEGQRQLKPRRVVVGAREMPSVTPSVKQIDLRRLTRRPKWRRGDAIRYIPRRFTMSPKYIAHLEGVKPRPAVVDPLMELQRGFPQQRAFTSPDLNLAGIGFTGATPPDPVLDVGTDYVIQSTNSTSSSAFNIYDKTDGSLVAGPLEMESLAANNTDCAEGAGDPIVLYDEMAGRWLLSEFSDFGNKLCVYISITGDPILGGWYAYQFQAPEFPDYPKYGVWLDGYYVGTNENSGPALYVMDRTSMLAGFPASLQSFSVPGLGGFGFQMLTPADHDGTYPPPAGRPGYFLRHRDDESHNASPNGAQDYLEVYEVSVDWVNSNNSQLSGPTTLGMAEFDSDLCGLFTFSCLPQPNGATPLDPLREVVMWRAQYRNMGTHESIVGSHVTDTTGLDEAGVRWWELRKVGASDWSLYQEGTYSPDSHNRWMSSIAMDQAGNIAMGYSVGSSSLNAGIRYAGRLSTDPAGVMSQSETSIQEGGGQQWSDRWGDYSSLNVDPSDGCTFWYTNEYVVSGGSGNWATKVASFTFDECLGGSIGLSGTNLSQEICAPDDLYPIQLDVVGVGDFTDDVTLSLAGLPTGFSGTFSSNPVTPGNSSLLQMSVSGTASAGTQNFQIVGSAVDVDDAVLVASVGVYTVSLSGVAPDLTSPANGSTQNSSTPTLSWSSVAQAIYTVEVDDDPNFGSIDYTWTGTSTTHKLTWGLSANTVYSWRVRVTNPCGGSGTSDTRTFDISLPTSYCQTPNLSIPDGVGLPVYDWLEVDDADTIDDLKLQVDITHTYVGDLSVSLTKLTSLVAVDVIDRPGYPDSNFGCSEDDIDVTLSDAALDDVEDECDFIPPAISGTLKPNNPLSAFDGLDINGIWQLSVADHEFSDTGELVSWCLVPTLTPEPGAGLMLMSGILFMAAERALRRRSR